MRMKVIKFSSNISYTLIIAHIITHASADISVAYALALLVYLIPDPKVKPDHQKIIDFQ